MNRLISSAIIILLMSAALTSCAQLMVKKEIFTKSDSLRGSLTSPYRTCYDINFYHLDVKVNPKDRFISGSVVFKFTATNHFKTLQFDLFDNLNIDKIIYHGKELSGKREFNAVFLTFPQDILKGKQDSFQVFYSGKPTVAKRAPWDGGFVFAKHDGDKDWIATACQGVGASIWWPNKDQQADEVDSALISISVPNDIMDVSNGRLVGTTDLKNGYTRYDWKVVNPINNYDIAVNAANYAHFSDTYKGLKGNLSMDFYVLPENLEKAKTQFNRDVPRMLKAFEYWFGPYPFYKDGYKLVETPHLGMEHQSAVAYGNKYQNGYLGRDRSATGWGLKWDFIIIHESGHEWFGNNITSKDIADMWIHESFTTYSENLFVEYFYGKEAGADYVIGQRKNIKLDGPIIGVYGVNKEGSGDMYDKGANLLHTIRQIINNDEKWRSILTGLNTTFGKKTTTTTQVVNYFNQQSGTNFTPVFDQYLRYKNIPVLEFKQEGNQILMRWKTDVKDFAMPVRLAGQNNFVYPTNNWKVLKTATSLNDIKVDRNFYVDAKIIN
ncbi:MAG: M1 family metallopeptidase [Bacteroidetes bacterium]|nr:M1 family metallopeptidase [Bacteroidota bacterium]MBU1483871.1 M1 family metallopeptidase [Bacteroidota bacterium]MBU2269659.1 M1 family metallopeptidase [Bacteroidota bacterium]MBU2375621.1 M1 family metallopeptidase [Bacteroidota bacterium]